MFGRIQVEEDLANAAIGKPQRAVTFKSGVAESAQYNLDERRLPQSHATSGPALSIS